MQNLRDGAGGGQTKCLVGDVEVVNMMIFYHGLFLWCQGIILWKEAIDKRENGLTFSTGSNVILQSKCNCFSENLSEIFGACRKQEWDALKKQALIKTSQMEPYTRTFTRKYMVKVKIEHVVI